MSFRHPNPLLRARATGHGGHQQSVGQSMEVEAAIEAVGDGAEVALGVRPSVAQPASLAEDCCKSGERLPELR